MRDGEIMAKKQPGCMLYFDVRPSLKRFSLEEKGRLFEAILDFGEYGVIPELDGALAVAWDFIQPRLEKDRDRYVENCEKRRDNANARWEKERMQKENALACKSIQVIPTTTQHNSTSTSHSTPTPTGAAAQNREMEFNDRRNSRLAALDEWEKARR